ncbi:hypothetical protein OIU78_015541 [Salix suchowensis]|nr:hypothetical protein OIU78_015541 [Salix suchowensis]
MCISLHLQGIKPASLRTVGHTQINEFIEKCLLPASERLSAKELLKRPFLQLEIPILEQIRDPLPVPNQFPISLSLPKSGPQFMDIDENQLSESTCTGSNNGSPKSPVLEYQRAHKKNESGLMGMKNDDYSASLTLRISDLGGKDFDRDTAISVASEMVEQLELADHDVAFIAELIDSLQIMRNILPGWKPSSCGSSNVAIADMEDQESHSSVVSEILVQGASSINNRTSEYYITDGTLKGTNGYVTGSELGDTYLNCKLDRQDLYVGELVSMNESTEN